MFNVLDYIAVWDASADHTAAFQAACNDAGVVRGTVIVPPPPSGFDYNIQGQVTVPNFVRIMGEHAMNPRIQIKTGANPATATFVLGTGCVISGLTAIYEQPDTSVLAEINDDYKPFVFAVAYCDIGFLYIVAAWDAIILNSSQIKVHDCRISAFNNSITVDNSRDWVLISDTNLSSNDLTAAQETIVRATNLNSNGILVGTADFLVISNCLILSAGKAINTDFGTGPEDPYIYVTNLWLDGPNSINITKGFVTLVNVGIPGDGHAKVTQSGGTLNVIGGTHKLVASVAAEVGLFELSGGYLNITGASFTYFDNATCDQHLVRQTGGFLSFANNTINRGSVGPFVRATFYKTAGRATIIGNTHSALTASTGTFIFASGSTSGDLFGPNSAPGWSNTIPAGSVFSLPGSITDSVPLHADVYNDAIQAIANNTPTLVTFNSEVNDNDGIHSTSANTERLVCQHAGRYRITANVCFHPHGTGFRSVSIRLGGLAGPPLAADTRVPISGESTHINLGTERTMAVGEFVVLSVHQTSGGPLNLGAEPVFSMTRLD